MRTVLYLVLALAGFFWYGSEFLMPDRYLLKVFPARKERLLHFVTLLREDLKKQSRNFCSLYLFGLDSFSAEECDNLSEERIADYELLMRSERIYHAASYRHEFENYFFKLSSSWFSGGKYYAYINARGKDMDCGVVVREVSSRHQCAERCEKLAANWYLFYEPDRALWCEEGKRTVDCVCTYPH